MTDCPNLHTATLAELVAWYNENSGKAPLKAFRNRAQATERCMSLLSECDAEPDEPTDPTSAAAQLEAANAEHEPEADADDPDLVHLKQICFDLDVEPRIARRRLRKAIGKVGTGNRWAWKKDSPELSRVRQILAGALPEASITVTYE